MNNEPKKYEEKYKLVQNQILEISKATKRKPGYVKIAIDDDLAEKLIRNNFINCLREDFIITGFALSYGQLKKEFMKDK